MSRRPAPSKKDRHGNNHGRPVGIAARRRDEVAVPALAEGDARCSVCRNAVRLTPRGYLRTHSDLFGNPCSNKAVGEATGIVAPPIVIPPAPRVPAGWPANEAERFDRDSGSRLDVGSECRECGKWLPGERSLCGRCFVFGGGR